MVDQRAVNWREAAAVLPLLTALAAWLLQGAVHSGFRYDDAQHLHFALLYSPLQYFAQREVMLEMSYAHIAPWNALAFDIALVLFGLDGRGHHSLLMGVIVGCAWATWLLLRSSLAAVPAALGAALFLAMPGTGVVGHLLMTAHYAWGLLFSLLALLAYQRAVTCQRKGWAVVAAFCYCQAALCKEIYVPLPLLWPWLVPGAWRAAPRWLPQGPWHGRLLMLVPTVLTMAGYAGVRLHVLDGVGGYGALSVASASTQAWAAVVGLIGQAPASLLGGGWVAALAASLLLLCWWPRASSWRWRLSSLRQPTSARLGWLCALLVLILPVLPAFAVALPYGHERVLLLLGWAVACGTAWQVGRCPRRQVVGLLLLVCLTVGQARVVHRVLALHDDQAAQNDWLLAAGPDQPLMPRHFGSEGALRLMAGAVALHTGRLAPTVLRDEQAFVELAPDVRTRTGAWNTDCRCVKALGSHQADWVLQWRQRLDAGQDRHLAGRVELEDHGRVQTLRWQISSDPGRVDLIVAGYHRVPLPPSGSLGFGLDHGIPLGKSAHVRLQLTSADGAVTRTPWQALPMAGGGWVAWP